VKVVVDVNLPPSLATALSSAGVEAVHWTTQGKATAPDAEILAWARRGGWVVLTQDLDFPGILAATGADAPSVLLVRDTDALAPHLVELVVAALRQCADALARGAIVVLDVRGRRVRVLPIE
jgi:predicted nuclease of predicted toxin-antitoxin system